MMMMAWVKTVTTEMLPNGYVLEIFVVRATGCTSCESRARKDGTNNDMRFWSEPRRTMVPFTNEDGRSLKDTAFAGGREGREFCFGNVKFQIPVTCLLRAAELAAGYPDKA